MSYTPPVPIAIVITFEDGEQAVCLCTSRDDAWIALLEIVREDHGDITDEEVFEIARSGIGHYVDYRVVDAGASDAYRRQITSQKETLS